ncbi:hypothetical protein OAU50_05665 [Planctomycetota bacterium]|nr:hypothetical protein [Planctomycetota bacterium]
MQRTAKSESSPFVVAPFLGLLAGFLFNRATEGSVGVFLGFEMFVGALSMTLFALAMANMQKVRQQHAAAIARRQAELVKAQQRRHNEIVAAERARYDVERQLRTQLKSTNQRMHNLESHLFTQSNTSADSQLHEQLQQASHRIEQLEEQSRLADEATKRIKELEQAQQELSQQHVSIGLKVQKEAEEVKASLVQLAITDSQRARNAEAPDNDQSGRIVQLEARIRRLARELERLSERQPTVADEGVASNVKPGGTKDNARVGFLRAMLDANKTLRKQVKEAA